MTEPLDQLAPEVRAQLTPLLLTDPLIRAAYEYIRDGHRVDEVLLACVIAMGERHAALLKP